MNLFRELYTFFLTLLVLETIEIDINILRHERTIFFFSCNTYLHIYIQKSMSEKCIRI